MGCLTTKEKRSSQLEQKGQTSKHVIRNTNKEHIVIFWIITDKDYSELRKIVGCEKLYDLKATKTDSVHIVNFAKELGVAEDQIFRSEGASLEELKQTFNEINTLTRKISYKDEKEHTLIVYCGGHGASYCET